MDELIGKGLSIWMIIQLLVLMSATLVPLALPLGILLASIMTFGNLGENFELVAVKAAGISLVRFLSPLLIFITVIASLAFVFNNNVIPVANLKALSLLYDLRNSKPAFNIKPGQFYMDIPNYSIRVGSKDKDDRTIHNVIIYDHSSGFGNDKIVLADKGEMLFTADKQFLIFRLKDGWRYEENSLYNGPQNNYEQKRIHFKQMDKALDLSSLKFTRTNENLFKESYKMLNVAQLSDGLDSLKKTEAKTEKNINVFATPYLTIFDNAKLKDSLLKIMKADTLPIRKYHSSFAELIKSDSLHRKVIQQTASNVRNLQTLIVPTATDRRLQGENFIKYRIEWHRKFSLSFACILLFLIGAPLGAIIRKGGLGMPLVIAVGFFVVYYFTSIIGEKLASAGTLPVWIGMWFSTFILLPFAIFLINQARKDSKVLSREWYVKFFNFFAATLAKLLSKEQAEEIIKEDKHPV